MPPEKLLVFNVKEGWEPLCAFLNVPVPQDEGGFPGTNEPQDIKQSIAFREKIA